MNDDMHFLSEHLSFISEDNPVKILIQDPMDCDMTFTLRLATDQTRSESYTRYHVIDKANAEIIIYNVGDSNSVSVRTPIELGTYKLKYRLFLDYSMVKTEKNCYTLQARFYTQKL